MENYWHYLTDGGYGNLPPFSKAYSNPAEGDEGFAASSTVVIGTEERTVYLGWVMRKDGLLRWYDLDGKVIENVNKWNYLPTDY